ncbi:MAG TPA: glycoside hydrolase family 15 protein [Gemmatimonadaceae bacterium]|nr:glycoside hydrolase family 15 protein [Gemmatimonadaceae bacterium]
MSDVRAEARGAGTAGATQAPVTASATATAAPAAPGATTAATAATSTTGSAPALSDVGASARRTGSRGIYAPIADYGMIGDLHTVALIGLSGSIDWCCLPNFDSPSVFGGLLDAERGGRFRMAPVSPYASSQAYLPSTAILVTTFRSDSGVVELTDFMPVGRSGGAATRPFAEIHRRLTCTQGEMEIGVTFAPRFDYATAPAYVHPRRNGVLATDADDEVLTLASPPELWWQLDGGVARVTLKLRAGESTWFVLRYDDDEVQPVAAYESERKLEEAEAFWRDWVGRLTYTGPFVDAVVRSALTLKLLCYEPTGAIIAAPTTSLPEEIGGVRNWDYRYTWVRDSAFVLYSLSILGHSEEADRFMSFLKRVARKTTDTHLQIMYGIDGRRHLTEEILPHLEGYRGSGPVRIGNAAYDQLQLDVYGELLETAYLWSRGNVVSEGTWVTLERLVSWVAANWRRPDSGIWEVRAGLQHYVLSKVMCWVALDRGIRMAKEFGLPAPIARWEAERDAVHADVMDKGWSEAKQSFVQYYGTEELDASNLAISMVRFLPRTHPRIVGTVHAVLRELTSDDQELVYRYRNEDGVPGGEGVFSICTFWLAEALALAGECERAEKIFRRMLTHANHVGLYSEELNPRTGEFLGNFPQAFTHIALINCAHVLDLLGKRGHSLTTGEFPQVPSGASRP